MEIAQERDITPDEVRQEMIAAIHFAFNNPDKRPETAAEQAQIPCEGSSPTLDEFIWYIASKWQKYM